MSKKDQIIKVAFESFYKHGFQGTAVDKLLLKSGISKRTLYKYFSSKEDLIRETILFYRQNSFDEMVKQIEKKHKNPVNRILAVFDAKDKKLKNNDYSGCFATNAALEFDGRNKKIESQCSKVVEALEKFMLKNCQEAKFKNPKKLAQQIVILLQGTTVYAQSNHNSKSALLAKEVVKLLLANASKNRLMI